MPKVTFLVEIDFDRAFMNAEQERYIMASIEESLPLVWHDYMVNEDVAPQQPSNVSVRWHDGRLSR